MPGKVDSRPTPGYKRKKGAGIVAGKTRLTKQKQLILSILEQAGEPLTPAEIYRRASKIQPALAKSTVYRNLEAMQERGEAVRGQLENGESFYSAAGDHPHRHYMICRDCNRMQDLPECPLAHLEQEIAGAADFVVTDHVVQVYGYCRDCAKKHIRK